MTIYAQCRECSGWTRITKGEYGQMTKDAKCAHCGSSNFDPHSATSARTYDPDKMKRRRPKGVQKKWRKPGFGG